MIWFKAGVFVPCLWKTPKNLSNNLVLLEGYGLQPVHRSPQKAGLYPRGKVSSSPHSLRG
jgi:hypothetical protein